MNQLKVISLNGQLVTESRQVAEMVGKEHWEILRMLEGTKDGKTKGFINTLGDNNFVVSDFFIKHSYTTEQNKEMPCYLLTRKGCDMVANKMTGEKGVLFTAAYVTRFEEMEQELNKPKTQLEIMQMQIEQMVKQEQRINVIEEKTAQIEAKQDNITEIISLNPTEWRKKVTRILSKIAEARGGYEAHRLVRNESYEALEERAKCKLALRVSNKQKNLSITGAGKTAINKVSKIDVIADDTRLTEIYLAIVKEMAIKHQISVEGLGA